MKFRLSFAFAIATAVQCQAQVVQLPAVSNFGVSTTVSVPDQGTASLGGVGRSSSGTTTRGAGPMGSRASGSQNSANSASISATIIDLAAMDEALLNMPADSSKPPNYTVRRTGTKIVNTLTPHHYNRERVRPAAPPQPYDWMRALGPQGNDQYDSAESKLRDGSNVRYFMERAAEAHALGRDSAARVYYQMALDRMTPAQQQRMDEIRAKRAIPEKSKKDKAETKTPETAPATPAASGGTTASPFDPPAAPAGANTDMNSAPF